jgi:hypothetical protein
MSRLSIENMPRPKKAEERKKRLGLIKKNATISKSFRLRVETNEMLTDLANVMKKKLRIKNMNRTQILELLINDAFDNQNRLMTILRT